MEPNLVTDPKNLDVLDELVRREPIFHRPEFGTTRADFGASALSDGRVLIAGGFDGDHDLAAAEAWDPPRGLSTQLPNLAAPRRNPVVVRPPGSTLVLIGGGEVKGAEIFNSETAQFTPATESDGTQSNTITLGTLDSAGRVRDVKIYVLKP